MLQAESSPVVIIKFQRKTLVTILLWRQPGHGRSYPMKTRPQVGLMICHPMNYQLVFSLDKMIWVWVRPNLFLCTEITLFVSLAALTEWRLYIRAIRPGFKCRHPHTWPSSSLERTCCRVVAVQGVLKSVRDGNVRPATPSLRSFVCPRPLILFFEIQQMRSLIDTGHTQDMHFSSQVLSPYTSVSVNWLAQECSRPSPLKAGWCGYCIIPGTIMFFPLLLEMNIVCFKVSVVVPSVTPPFSLSLFHLGTPF